MSLYDELALDVDELLADPDIRTGEVIVRRVTGETADLAKPWIRPTRQHQELRLRAVVFTQEAEYSAGTLVLERGDEITASTRATVVRENDADVSYEVDFAPLSSDVFVVDGDERRVVRVVGTPAAGTPVAWTIRVAD